MSGDRMDGARNGGEQSQKRVVIIQCIGRTRVRAEMRGLNPWVRVGQDEAWVGKKVGRLAPSMGVDGMRCRSLTCAQGKEGRET